MSLHPPREASRATKEGIIISKYPDVCRSPTAPVPYTIVAYQHHDANTASSVFMTGQRAHKQNSIVIKCMGDEPGVGLGVKSGTVSSICHRKEHSKTVRIEGQWATRDTDEWWMNNRNTTGKLCWPKHNKTFDPTPPLKETSDSPQPAAISSDEGKIMSDAAPVNNWVSGAEYATYEAARSAPQSQPAPQNQPVEKPAGSGKPVTSKDPQPDKEKKGPPKADNTNKPKPASRWWKISRFLRTANPYLKAAEFGLDAFFYQPKGAEISGVVPQSEREDEIIAEAKRMLEDDADSGEVRRWLRQEITAERQRVKEEEHTPPVPYGRTAENESIRRRKRRFRRNCRLRKYREGCLDALPYATPHHIVADRSFRTPSGELYEGGIPHADGYTICVEGGTPIFRGPNANEHGLIHGIYNPAEKALGLSGTPTGTARLDALEAEGVAAAAAITGCDPAEMLKELQNYHRNERNLSGEDRFRADPTGKLSVDSKNVGRGTGRSGSRNGM